MPQTLIRDLSCFDSPLAISKYSSLYLRETLPLASPGHPSLLFLISPELSSKVNTAENGAQSCIPAPRLQKGSAASVNSEAPPVESWCCERLGRGVDNDDPPALQRCPEQAPPFHTFPN